MKRRWVIMALPLAVVVNFGLLGLAPLLSHERGRPEEEELPSAVSLVKLTPPAPPEKEEVKEPTPPPPQQKQDFTPDLMQPEIMDFGDPTLGGIAIDLGGIAGGAVGGELVFEAYELDQAPQPLVKMPPVYPYRAREQGIEGVVQIKFLVRADGTVGQVIVQDARPKGLFEDAVLKAVPNWKFSPGKVEGEAVTAWVVTAVRFEL
jgi:protein TonB